MTVISKPLFYEKIGKELQCKDLHYWNESCVKCLVFSGGMSFVGCLKFFLPIYVIKAIISHKKFKHKTFWKNLFIGEIRSAIYGMFLANLFLVSNCILCKLTGRLHYYSLGLMSGIMSGITLLIETKENRLLNTLIFVHLVVEAFLNNINYFNVFRLTRTRQTAMFMTVSSLLMYLLQNRKQKRTFKNFWFYTPPVFQQYTDDNSSKSNIELKCEHKGACSNFAVRGIQKYFVLGYGFSIVKKIIPKMLTVFKKPLLLYPVLINRDNVKFGAFIGAYVGIYRLRSFKGSDKKAEAWLEIAVPPYVMCYLLKTNFLKQKYFGAIAGALSGIAYSISPNLQVMSVGITTILQVFFNALLKQLQIKNKVIPQQLVFMLCNGLLFHNAIACKVTCPNYFVNMLSTTTNKVFSKMYNNIIVSLILNFI